VLALPHARSEATLARKVLPKRLGPCCTWSTSLFHYCKVLASHWICIGYLPTSKKVRRLAVDLGTPRLCLYTVAWYLCSLHNRAPRCHSPRKRVDQTSHPYDPAAAVIFKQTRHHVIYNMFPGHCRARHRSMLLRQSFFLPAAVHA
jgi:hypothetical protein